MPHREYQKHRATKAWKGHSAGKTGTKEHHSLVSIFQTWETFANKDGTPNAAAQITKVSSSSSSDSDSSSSDESSDDDVAMADAPVSESSSSDSSSSDSSSESDSDSDSGSDEETAVTSKRPASKAIPATKPLKRKAESDSDSSSSDSDSDEDMSGSSSKSGNKKPQPKKLKTRDSSDESSSSDSSSESDSSSDDSSDDEKVKPTKAKKVESDGDSSSESDSDDPSSSESESDSEDEVEVAAKVALPDSDSDSSSDSESGSEDKKVKIKKDGAANGSASDTSVTLEKASPEFAPLPPNPTTFKANNRGQNGSNAKKTQNQPFSRISKDVVVDPRLSSNAYVTHGYGEQAHRDLIVTKGKGFTKEKNKKKRGSYKGGPLDVHTSRSFKFDD
ncbi:hypothetical protein NUW58_g703 [Xylaria curta]|uniref:Uncharacterized protein n=1 Tax=Xylaria curta TaxID=42375 RepID=A0ACC1PR12_9PEZI|nr:hypothetical protein NUW58_g703 [Xylaria curta]